MSSTVAKDEDRISSSSALNNCIILGLNSTVPWDNPHNLVSFQAWSLFDRIMSANLIPILFLIGIPSNILNLVVFFKQGLQERINLCLFTLALVDIISLIVIIFNNVDHILAQFSDWERYGPVFRYLINNNVGGIYGFTYGSAFLSAVISTERCICVLFPLKAQRCMPTKVFGFFVILAVLVISLTHFAVTAMFRVACFYEIRTQRLTWQFAVNDYFFENQAMITALNGVFYGFCIRLGCPVIVLVTTVITAVKLTHTVRWRHQTSSSLSSKEIGVTKMLIALSIEFVILSIPVIIVSIAPPFEPKMKAGDVYMNLYRILLGLNQLCISVSCSVNFFVYYSTGTKYRGTFHSLFNRKTWK